MATTVCSFFEEIGGQLVRIDMDELTKQASKRLQTLEELNISDKADNKENCGDNATSKSPNKQENTITRLLAAFDRLCDKVREAKDANDTYLLNEQRLRMSEKQIEELMDTIYQLTAEIDELKANSREAKQGLINENAKYQQLKTEHASAIQKLNDNNARILADLAAAKEQSETNQRRAVDAEISYVELRAWTEKVKSDFRISELQAAVRWATSGVNSFRNLGCEQYATHWGHYIRACKDIIKFESSHIMLNTMARFEQFKQAITSGDTTLADNAMPIAQPLPAPRLPPVPPQLLNDAAVAAGFYALAPDGATTGSPTAIASGMGNYAEAGPSQPPGGSNCLPRVSTSVSHDDQLGNHQQHQQSQQRSKFNQLVRLVKDNFSQADLTDKDVLEGLAVLQRTDAAFKNGFGGFKAAEIVMKLVEQLRSNGHSARNSNALVASGHECAICYEPMSDGKVSICPNETCREPYHKNCVEQWLSRANVGSCPNCRTPWTSSEQFPHLQ